MNGNTRGSLILLLWLLIASAVSAQNAPACKACGKEITREYIVVEGQNFHYEHFTCKRCGGVIGGSYAKVDNAFYHPDCAAEQQGHICKTCGKPLTGEYVESGGSFYHEACYRGSVLPRCAVCGEPLSGTYSVNEYGDQFHTRHTAEVPECCSCYRPIAQRTTRGGVRYADGRAICNICYAKAVTDAGTLNRLLEQVHSKLGGYGLAISRNVLSIKGVDQNQLAAVAGNNEPITELRGFCKSESSTEYTNGKQTNKKYKHTIYVLNGLPSLQTESVIAHELMHAWIYENTGNTATEAVTEGSCNFASWLYLQTGGDSEAPMLIKRMEKNPDPVYGKGFLTIRAQFAGKPLTALLQWLKQQ